VLLAQARWEADSLGYFRGLVTEWLSWSTMGFTQKKSMKGTPNPGKSGDKMKKWVNESEEGEVEQDIEFECCTGRTVLVDGIVGGALKVERKL
jgi:hypothetical protein